MDEKTDETRLGNYDADHKIGHAFLKRSYDITWPNRVVPYVIDSAFSKHFYWTYIEILVVGQITKTLAFADVPDIRERVSRVTSANVCRTWHPRTCVVRDIHERVSRVTSAKVCRAWHPRTCVARDICERVLRINTLKIHWNWSKYLRIFNVPIPELFF